MGTRHIDTADMQFKVVFLVALICVSTPSELYLYTLPRTELFHSECLSELPIRMHGAYNVSTVYMSKQRRFIGRTKIIV